MKSILRAFKERFLVVPGIKLAKRRPSPALVGVVRWLSGIQISTRQLLYIMEVVGKKTKKARKTPCSLLVFGLGNDTVFWSLLNQGGNTVFLEDNEFWLKRICQQTPGIKAVLVEFNTKRSDWKKLLESPASLDMSLPDEISAQKWDIVVVDGPAGYDDNTSGRMKSIYTASKLVKSGGDVFVHDCNREIEDIYCNELLKPENLSVEIRHPIGWLRHYGVGE
jgi:glucuronoxylan 4-O-methyltransferase